MAQGPHIFPDPRVRPFPGGSSDPASDSHCFNPTWNTRLSLLCSLVFQPQNKGVVVCAQHTAVMFCLLPLATFSKLSTTGLALLLNGAHGTLWCLSRKESYCRPGAARVRDRELVLERKWRGLETMNANRPPTRDSKATDFSRDLYYLALFVVHLLLDSLLQVHASIQKMCWAWARCQGWCVFWRFPLHIRDHKEEVSFIPSPLTAHLFRSE